MIEVKVDDGNKIKVSRKKDELFINDQSFEGEIVKIDTHLYKVYKENKIFRVEVVDSSGKEITLKVNDHLMNVNVTDHIDQILDKLGMNVAASTAVKDVKAPMPGSILNIIVTEGAEVSQGDQLLVLEAMKMENVIKSPGEGKVSKIHVSEKENVEKNQVLISFE
ncbi:acetyl-CoA carboxylase biotin carboxyl carrier protein subunit [Ekhidna sp. To15]|uniref:acetyl-CoA carboxylase biotin carboxyl carrier protein subunit n=1 Tax=Ekhidna sp. To15 TaxID=3395267 RepID=UPI003F528EEA